MVATFDQPHASSDGGAILVKAADRHLGLLAALTATVPDARASGRVTHGVGDLLAQRVFANHFEALERIDRISARALGLSIGDVNATLAITFGSAYANDFSRDGRILRVLLAADAPFRMTPQDVLDLRVRNAEGRDGAVWVGLVQPSELVA